VCRAAIVETLEQMRKSERSTTVYAQPELRNGQNIIMEKILGIMIPILSIVLGLGTAMLSIYLSYRKRKEMFNLYHQERMAALDKGVELPPIPDGFFSAGNGRRANGRDLLRGLVWLFVGLGLGVALFANGRAKYALFALIPVGIGLAYLIYYGIEGRREPDTREEPKSAAPTGLGDLDRRGGAKPTELGT